VFDGEDVVISVLGWGFVGKIFTGIYIHVFTMKIMVVSV
jgi:hypothetical protein